MSYYAERQPLSGVSIDQPASTEMTDDQTPQEWAEQVAREMLGMSAEAAFAKLDAGELDGTVAGDAMASARWLLPRT